VWLARLDDRGLDDRGIFRRDFVWRFFSPLLITHDVGSLVQNYFDGIFLMIGGYFKVPPLGIMKFSQMTLLSFFSSVSKMLLVVEEEIQALMVIDEDDVFDMND